MHGCDLKGADFSNAQLLFASFLGADMHKANFDQADLGGVNFSSANMAEATFRGAKLVGAPLFSASQQATGRTLYPIMLDVDLTGADLRGAVLDHIDLSKAKLGRANFSGADLRNCVGLASET